MLHTSDWHLGRNFGQIALLDDQARFCDWLVDTAVAEDVDLVVVAGDIYDRAVPPIDAIALFRGTVGRLAAAGIKVVAIAGNHDSPERLSAADGLTDAAGVFIRGGYARASDTITLEFADGPLDVVAVPYLDPLLAPVTATRARPTPDADADADADTHHEPDANCRQPQHPFPANSDTSAADAELDANCRQPRRPFLVNGDSSRPTAVNSTAQQLELFPTSVTDSSPPGPRTDPSTTARLALSEPHPHDQRPASHPERADTARQPEPEPERPTHQSVLAAALRAAPRRAARAIAVVHAFVAGGVESESERMLSVGGSDRITAGTLHGFGYVALGHLHTPQVLNRESRRYSGSPLPYSFSETAPKQVVIADLSSDGTAHVTPVAVPVGRPVAVLQGMIDELLGSPAHTDVEQHFVRAVLTDAEHVLDAKLRLQRRFPYVTEVVLAPPARQAIVSTSAQRATLDPFDAALSFWIDVNGRPASAAERGEVAGVIAEAVREVRQRNEAGLRA